MMTHRPNPLSSLTRRLLLVAALCSSIAAVRAQVTGTALVRHAPSINGTATIDGSVQQMTAESITINGGANVTGDLLLPGLPTVRLNGSPIYGGTLDGTGAATPTSHQVTINGNVSLRHVIRRTNAVALPTVTAPPQPAGTRTVSINSSSQSPGNFATLRNLTLNGSVGQFAIPPGTYGDFTANGGGGFTLGVAGATQPSVYNFQHLTLNGQTQLQIIGPVLITVANGFTGNGAMGSSANPARLTLNIYSGGFTLNGGCNFYGFVNAPNGTVIVNGNTQLIGGVTADRLTVNGGGLLRLASAASTNHAPVAANVPVSLNEDTATTITLAATDADGQALTYTVLSSPAHGALGPLTPAAGNTATITYTPAPNYFGPDTFTFKAGDGQADSNTASVNITVANVPDRPVADAKTAILDEDTPANVILSGTDGDGDALTFSVVAEPTHGVLSGTGATRTYTPALNYNGPDSFTYVASDGSLTSTPATVTITVRPMPDRPVAFNGNYSVNEGATVNITLTGADVDGQSITFNRLSMPSNGTLTGTAPNYVYTPNANFGGTDSFTFNVSDGLLTSDPATITIHVVDLNFRPVAQSDTAQTDEDTAKTVTLRATDQDGNAVTFSIVTHPTKGTLSPITPGSGNTATVVYTPNANENGSDSFTFKANDGSADSDVATIAVTVNAVNDAPVAEAQPVGTDEDHAVTIVLTASDVENNALTFSVVTAPTKGTLSPITQLTSTTASVTYTPNANANGPDTFSFKASDATKDSDPVTVTLTVNAINDAPVAAAGSDTALEDTPRTITLTGTDLDSASLTFEIVDQPTHGTVGPVTPGPGNTGLVTYTPAQDSNANDSFTFRAFDGENYSTPATVTLTVTPVNDQPVAIGQDLVQPQDTPFNFTLQATDADANPLTYRIVTDPTHGTLSAATGGPNFTYTPNANYRGDDLLVFVANDGTVDSEPATVKFKMAIVLHPPVVAASQPAVTLAEDSTVTITLSATDLDNDPLTYEIAPGPTHGTLGPITPAANNTATVLYTPATNYHGPDTLSFRAFDGGLYSDYAAVAITVTSVNDQPTASSQSASTDEDIALDLTLTATDVETEVLTYEIVTHPTHGTVAPRSGGPEKFIYTPTANYSGPDSFTFKAIDADNAPSNVATVSIEVRPINDPPVAASPSVQVDEDGSVTITLTATDVDSANLTFVSVGTAQHGTFGPITPLTATSARITYTPTGDFSGTDTFTFRANDGTADSALATVTVEVRPINDRPVAHPQTVAASPSSVATITLTGFDLENSPLTFAKISDPSGGTLGPITPLSSTTASVTYTPRPDFGGFDSFMFTVSDGALTSAPATIQLFSGLPPRSRTYTTTADFNEGTLKSVSTEVPDQLTNQTILASFDVVWIANSSKGTVAKLDPETGRVIAEYAAAPVGVVSPYPSRIAIDSKGNAWVANLSHNSIIKIGLVENGFWVDRNGNGTVDTSGSLGDLKAWTGSAVATATDEAILLYARTDVSSVRHISVDANDDVWVGGLNGAWEKIDGETGLVVASQPSIGQGGNGGFTTPDGRIFSTGSRFLVWDPTLPIASQTVDDNIRNDTWASAIDSQGNIWTARDGTSTVAKYSPTGELLGEFYHGEPWGMGIAIDANDHVWVAHSHCGHAVGHLLPNGQWLGNVEVANHGPVEVSIDRHGRIWVVSSTGVVERINPLGGPLGTDGVTPIGEVDVRSGNLGGTLWTYGRFIGSASALSTPQGTWSAIYDGQLANTTWGAVVWNGLICNDSKIEVDVALSANGTVFGPFQPLTVSNPTPSGAGRFLKTRVRLTSATTGETPQLHDVTVGTAGYTAPTTTPSWYVSAGADISANWPDIIQLKGAFCHSVHSFPTEPTYAWVKVSGPGGVSFSDATQVRPTAQFSALGTYVLSVTATLGAETRTDEITVQLAPYNRAPYANAGYTTFVSSFPPQIWLWGEVRDDGLPLGAPVTSTWSKLFGPGTVDFGSTTSPSTTAHFSVPGIYTLRLQATDTVATSENTTDVWIGVPAPPLPPDGIVSWWQASGNGDDHISGNQAFTEGGANYVEGKFGGAFHFLGSNDRVRVFSAPSLEVGKRDGITLEFWLKPTAVDRSATVFQYGLGSDRGFQVRQVNRNILVDFREAGGTSHLLTATNALTADTWTHITASYNRHTGEARLFINGIATNFQDIGLFELRTTGDIFLGGVPDRVEPYQGLLDETTLYNRALFGDEVTTIFTSPSGKRPPVSNLPPVVNAGVDLFAQPVGTPINLTGVITDDGNPLNGTLTATWSKVTGPGSVAFGNPAQAQTTATFSTAGVYLLKLVGNDGAFTTEDTVQVRVNVFSPFETDPSLIAWWPGDGSDLDVIHGHKAERINGAIFAPGKVDQAFSLDGSNDYLRVQPHPDLDVGTQGTGLTVEFWMQNPNIGGNDYPLFTWYSGGQETVRAYVTFNGLKFNWKLRDTNGVDHDAGTTGQIITYGQMMHMAFTYDRASGAARIFQNGILVFDSNVGSFTPNTSGFLWLASSPANINYRGIFDEFSIFKRALTPAEVAAIFQAGAIGKTPPDNNQPPVVDAGPELYIRNVGGSGTLLGAVTDDGKPLGGALTPTWSQVDGPVMASIANTHSAQTSVTFPAAGTYIFRLDANDGFSAAASDTTVVHVAVQSAAAPAGLAVWWPGDAHPREVLHGNHDVELFNGAGYAGAKVGQGFFLDGSNDYARVLAHPDLDVAAGSPGLTVEFWMQNPNIGGNDYPLFTWYSGGQETVRAYVTFNGLKFNWKLRDTNGLDHDAGTTGQIITYGQMMHVAFTYDRASGIARTFQNGLIVAETNIGSFIPRTSGDLWIGSSPVNISFKGTIDEFSAYTRALTPAEVAGLFSAGTSGKTLGSVNLPPVVSAGPDLLLPNTGAIATLSGSVTDDNVPFGPPTALWEKVLGPGNVDFFPNSAAATTATFTAPGIYLLKLTGTDGASVPISDLMEVRVATPMVVAGSELAAWWPANGHPREMVNGNHDVELFNGATYATAKVSQGFSFDGSNDYARVLAHPDLDVGASAAGLSVEFWMQNPNIGGNDYPLFTWYSGGQETVRAYVTFNGLKFNWRMRDTGGVDHDIGTTGQIITYGQMMHVALTYDRPSGVARLFQNGILQLESNIGSFTPRTTGDLWIGSSPANISYRGTMDEFSIYRRALTVDEVTALFNAGSNGKALLRDNAPPAVSAGPDIAVATVGSTVNLAGTVADDNRPFGAPTAKWERVDGPTNMSFANDTVVTTAATFNAAGTYLLRLTGSDGASVPVSDLVEVRVAQTTTPPPNDLAAWWPGNGHPREVVNGNHDLRLFNGVNYAPSRVSQAFNLNGSNQYMYATAHPDLDVAAGTPGMTVEFWMQNPNIGGNDYPLFAWYSGGVETVRAYVTFNGLKFNWRLRDTGGLDHDGGTTGQVITYGQMMHVAFTYDRTTGLARIYQNGVLQTETSAGSFFPRTDGSLWVASAPSNIGFRGTMDEFAIYRRALAPAEIAAIFNAGAAGKAPIYVNQPPVVDVGLDRTAAVGTPLSLSAAVTDDGLPNPPSSVTYQWSVLSGPGGVTFGTPTSLNTTATFDAIGAYTLQLAASDSVLTGTDTLVVSANAIPVIALTSPVHNSSVTAGVPLTLKATATQAVGTISKVEFFDGATKLGERTTADAGDPSGFTFTTNAGLASGVHTLTAKATASVGTSATSAPVTVTAIAYAGPAETKLIGPLEDARLTAPTTVTGIVAHSALTSWGVDYRLKTPEGAPAEPWVTFATGNTVVGAPANGSISEVPGELGTFDPTRLINGIYELQLRMSEAGGTTTIAGPFTVLVEGNMKIGAYTLNFEDMKVPVAGIPITITRTYDSRDTRIGDFGPGWRLALNNIRVQKNRNLGADWNQTDPNGATLQSYFVTSGRDRIVTVTFPDGETHRFRAGALVKQRDGDDDNESFPNPAREGKYRFYPIGDTTAKLEPLNQANEISEDIWIYGTGDQDLMSGDEGDPSATIFNTSRYRLTTKDGTIHVLDEIEGLLEMKDLNGNRLDLVRDGAGRLTGIRVIQNAPGGEITRTVLVHRDNATGLVDYIRDLLGREVDYLYDPQKRLTSFTDRELNVTQFRYENSSFPLYLTKVIDPRGVPAVRTEFDAGGRMVKQIDANGKEILFARGVDATGRFEKITDRLGNQSTVYYDTRGNVTLKVDPLGAQTIYDYYPDGERVKFETDHYGNTTGRAYDERGNVTVETLGASLTEDPAHPVTGYSNRTAYNGISAPTSIIDPDGRTQVFTYDPVTNLQLTHTLGAGGPAPATTTTTYDSDGARATETDALGNVTSFAYNYTFSSGTYSGAVKEVTETVTDPAGSAGSDSSNVASTVLRVMRKLYDEQENQLVEIVTRTLPNNSPEEVVTRFVYDGEDRRVAIIWPDGRVTETRYNAIDRIDKLVLWRTVSDYESRNDSLARITRYGYDARGNEVSISYPDGAVELADFDAENRKSWTQERNGFRTFFVYDAVGRLRFTIQPDGNDGVGAAAPSLASDSRLADNPRTEVIYDLIGRVRFQIDERGSTIEFTYDDHCGCALRRKSMIQHLATGNLVTHYGYDNAGNVLFTTDPRGNTIESRVDDQGRTYLVLYPPTDEHPATQIETKFDLLGRRVAIIDQEGRTARSRYDALGRLVETRQYLDQTLVAGDADFHLAATTAGVVATRYSHDEIGNLRNQTDALGRTTTYWSDGLGRRTKRVLPKDAAEATFLFESFEYDEWGNVGRRTDFAGKTTTFTYDEMNRLKSKDADATHPSLGRSNATARIEFDYDANGARSAARTYDAGHTLLYSETTPRDARGRLSSKLTAAGRLDYAYHENGLLKQVASSNPGGLAVGYRYDELNRLAAIDDTSTGGTRTSSQTYNANGSLGSVTTPNGLSHSFGYDALNRLRGLVVARGNTLLHSYELKLSPAGRRTQIVEGARSTTYTYDELDRLTGETIGGDSNGNNGAVSYDLDKVGNRIRRQSDLAALFSQPSRSFNARDWLQGDTYSAAGSTVTSPAINPSVAGTDTYDFEEHLVARTRADGSTVNFIYDADGHRIAKNVLDPGAQPLASTLWLIDANNLTGYAQVVEEHSSTPTATKARVYVYGAHLVSQAISLNGQAPTTSYFAFDGQGSTRELTDASGGVTDRYDFDAFGVMIFRAGTSDNPYLYRGQQFDADLGLYYQRARYLNVDEGRFWTMDTDEGSPDTPITLHKYLYANANPIRFADPSGNVGLNEELVVLDTASREREREVQERKNQVQQAKRALCRAGTAIGRMAIHHILPVFLGPMRKGGDPKNLVGIDAMFHQQLHTLMRRMLQLGGMKAPEIGKLKYLEMLLDPKNRKAVIAALRGTYKAWDKKCAPPALSPQLEELIRRKSWDF